MTEHTPRRRGPNKAKRTAPAAKVAVAAEPQEELAAAPKRRRRATVGGHAMKLDAPQRPGFHRRWMNDSGNRLADAAELGYDHVTERGIKSDNPGSRVSRLVGTQPNGEPLHAFLMETPDELYAEGVAEKEALNRRIDEAITAGSPTDGPIAPKGESYGQGSIQRDR